MGKTSEKLVIFISFSNYVHVFFSASTWKIHRKLLNPAFNQQVLNTFVNEINVQARSLVSQLASEVEKEPFQVRKYFVSFTLKTVSRK